jgi:4,5-dihydroxyphthalate decarboxylase
VNSVSPLMPLTFACGVYDRTVPLLTREVTVEGVDLTYVPMDEPRKIFDRMTGCDAFDLAEMSLSEYICRHVAGQNPFIALPVFPSRVFRHSTIVVNRKTVHTPADLAGKRIGLPLYTMTACVFIRGMLQHDCGVDLSGVRWVQGAINDAKAHGDPAAMPLLTRVDIENNTTGRSLSDLLSAGELDVIVGTAMPQSFKTDPDVVRLFPDFRTAEQDYFRRTSIYPIMHTVVMQRSVYDREPSLARRFYAAFDAAQQLARKRLLQTAALSTMLPWQLADVEESERIFGGDPWANGIEPNRLTLEALVTYLCEQQMIARTMPVEQLFAPVT